MFFAINSSQLPYVTAISQMGGLGSRKRFMDFKNATTRLSISKWCFSRPWVCMCFPHLKFKFVCENPKFPGPQGLPDQSPIKQVAAERWKRVSKSVFQTEQITTPLPSKAWVGRGQGLQLPACLGRPRDSGWCRRRIMESFVLKKIRWKKSPS